MTQIPEETPDTPTYASLETICARLRGSLEGSNRAREEALRLCREVIQHSSRAIRAVHRGEIAEARTLADGAKERVERTKTALRNYPDLFHAGYIHDSQKEFVEAEAMLAIVGGELLPDFDRLSVEIPAYLNGLAEAASESRRFVLERLKQGELERAENVLRTMDEIYYEMVQFDFPDAITGGLRRTTDSLRAVLERTRADLTLTAVQKRLETTLSDLLESQKLSKNEEVK